MPGHAVEGEPGLIEVSTVKDTLIQPCMQTVPPSGVDEALRLAAIGWAVFPLVPATGKPYSNADVANCLGVPEPPAGRGGCYLAKSDPDAVRALWAAFPDAQIGIATGAASGLYVLDIDRKNGKDGFAALQANGWEAPPTFWTNTRSGGRHYFYAVPRDGVRWFPSDSILGAGIDRKGDGGFVRWYGSGNSVPIVPPPNWMLSGPQGRQDRQPLGTDRAPSLSSVDKA